MKVKRPRGRPKKILKNKDDDIPDQEKNKESKKILINTLEHDIKGIIPVMNDVKELNGKKVNIIGDKGYIVNDEFKKKLAGDNINIITPYRKNQDKTNTSEEKDKLKKRCKVEHLFAKIKRYNRVHVRKDRKMINYLGFVYMACIKVC